MLGLKIQFGSYHALPIFGEVFMGIFFSFGLLPFWYTKMTLRDFEGAEETLEKLFLAP